MRPYLRKGFAVAAVALVALGISSQMRANVFSGTSPLEDIVPGSLPVAQIISDYQPPNTPAGYEVEGWGSSTFLSPCYLATNHHAVFNGAKGVPRAIGLKHKVRIPLGGKLPELTGRVVEYGEYDGDAFGDFAIVKLDRDPDGNCAGHHVGWFPVHEEPIQSLLEPEVRVTVAAYSIDAKENVRFTLQRSCKVMAIDQRSGRLFTNCTILPMMSGSPVLTMRPLRIGDKTCAVPHLVGLNAKERGAVQHTLETFDITHATVVADRSQFWSDPRLREEIRKDQKGHENRVVTAFCNR